MDVFVGSNLLSPLEVLKKYSFPDLLGWSCHGSEEMVTNDIRKIILKHTGPTNICSRIVIIIIIGTGRKAYG